LEDSYFGHKCNDFSNINFGIIKQFLGRASYNQEQQANKQKMNFIQNRIINPENQIQII
jgi:hypothetical protein